MKKNIPFIYIIVVSVLSFKAYSQSTFMKMYNGGNCGFAVRETAGNAFVFAGGTDFYYNYHWMTMSSVTSSKIHLVKADNTGNMVWQKFIGNPVSRSVVRWMENTSDGGFIMTGFDNKETSWPPDSNDMFLLKTDNAGNISWSRKFDSGKDELGFCVQQTFDGGYIISGFHDSVPSSLMGNTYVLLVKTDDFGVIQWHRKFQLAIRDFDTGEAFPYLVRQTLDSGFVLIGTTFGAHQADVLVIRVNSTGDLVWAKSYEHDNTVFRLSTGADITETNTGDFVIAGSMDKDPTLNQLNYPYILKISSTGSFLDAKIFEAIPPLMFQAGFSSVEQTSDGGFFFTGMGGYGGFGDQAQLLKTDYNFNTQWSRVYTWDGIATMGSRFGRLTSDGGFIFTGKRQFTGSVLLKTDSIGLIPCKNPGTLTPVIPSLLVVTRTPLAFQGLSDSPLAFNVQPGASDTSTLCELVVPTLPVELLSFTARQINENQVLLEWQTLSERNCDFFIIERSDDGQSFIETGKISGSGNSIQLRTYFISDHILFNRAVLYYRLKQVDFNGTSAYSKIISVKPVVAEKYLLKIIRNTVDNQLMRIIFLCRHAGYFSCTLSDLTGRKVFTSNYNAQMGINEITFRTESIPQGLYVVHLMGADASVSEKVVVR